MLYATAPAVEAIPRYTYTYKHIAHHAVHRALRQRRQGRSTSTTAGPASSRCPRWFSQVSGLPDPTSYAAWAELVLLRRRRASWCGPPSRPSPGRCASPGSATLLFICSNWIGQDYYSPQAFGYLMMLGSPAARADRRCRPAAGRFGTLGRAARPLAVPRTGPGRVPRASPPRCRTAAHRSRGLVLLCRRRPGRQPPADAVRPAPAARRAGGRRLPAPLVASDRRRRGHDIGYLLPNYDYVVDTFGLFVGPGPAGQRHAAKTSTARRARQRPSSSGTRPGFLACFVLAFVGVVRRARRGHVRDGAWSSRSSPSRPDAARRPRATAARPGCGCCCTPCPWLRGRPRLGHRAARACGGWRRCRRRWRRPAGSRCASCGCSSATRTSTC